MSSASPSIHSWLSVRIRLFAAVIFIASLFVPPYDPEAATTPPSGMEHTAQGFFLAEEGFLTKTSSLTEQGTRSAYTEGIIHTVEAGETLAGIARQAFLKPETVAWANGLTVNATVHPGQKLLLLPVDGILHTVKRGQNLQTIADLYGVPATKIAQQNNVTRGYLLAGQELIIPGGKPLVEVSQRPPTPQPGKRPPPPSQTATLPPAVRSATIPPTYGILQMPCDCFYTQYFGPTHFGVDLQERGGGPVFAAEAGTVVRADHGWNGGYGNVIEIDHGNGMVTLYGHNKELYVTAGQRVSRGQVISYMGNTGRVYGPTGIHLHFEVHQGGIKKNPLIYLEE